MSMRNVLVRPFAPRSIWTWLGAVANSAPRNRISAALALPSTGGAASRMVSKPARRAPQLVRLARGMTRHVNRMESLRPCPEPERPLERRVAKPLNSTEELLDDSNQQENQDGRKIQATHGREQFACRSEHRFSELLQHSEYGMIAALGENTHCAHVWPNQATPTDVTPATD